MQAPDLVDVPNIEPDAFERPTTAALLPHAPTHPPRILLLYGVLRERSFSRLQAQEAARLLEAFGTETRIFNPSGLPLPDDVPTDHPKVLELRDLSAWSEGQVWCAPAAIASAKRRRKSWPRSDS
ncbi:NAD(P)H-dependent oxidoreductase [Acidibrevibacterium fodinaquatile]